MAQVAIDRNNFGPPDILPHEIKYIKKIGGGCFGSVFLGECRGTTVAVKKLFKQDLNEKSLSEFKREVELASRLNNPNVLLFMGACTVPGEMAIVMELCDKGNLEQLLHNKNANLSLFRRMQMAKEIAMGMNWLHKSNPPIIHRDLKPSNLLVDKFGRIKICDFGLSQIKPDNGKLLDKGTIPGTPLWMAPEVMMGRPVDESADVYAYGIVLWEIVTQEVPFPEMTSYGVFRRAICTQNVRPPIPDNCPKSIKNLLEVCWHKDPETRPNFDRVITILSDILVEVAIREPFAADFWRVTFPGKDYIPFDTFMPEFVNSVGNAKPLTPAETELFKLLIGSMYDDGILAPFLVVTIEAFGNMLDYFGPMASDPSLKKNIVQRIVGTCKRDFFFGEISSKIAEQTHLRLCPPGTYLVRLSEGVMGCFTISRNHPSGIKHNRIYYKPGIGFTITYTLDSGEKKTVQSRKPSDSLRTFLKLIKNDLLLNQPAPNSQFAALFHRTITEVNSNPLDGYGMDNS